MGFKWSGCDLLVHNIVTQVRVLCNHLSVKPVISEKLFFSGMSVCKVWEIMNVMSQTKNQTKHSTSQSRRSLLLTERCLLLLICCGTSQTFIVRLLYWKCMLLFPSLYWCVLQRDCRWKCQHYVELVHGLLLLSRQKNLFTVLWCESVQGLYDGLESLSQCLNISSVLRQ